ncbi:hypothetical protein TNCT_87711 [Trichonephila clavata]|uniref:Uncharacterized protein n=1 Tax=Trichonephila clavata TaxID=2740835 RepID=A0A8X6HCE6_TRICU|nr:hypothetical protein TNCT_87711 [Trichonephila clavata]
MVENFDLFRETIKARNVYAAWARKLTQAKPQDPTFRASTSNLESQKCERNCSPNGVAATPADGVFCHSEVGTKEVDIVAPTTSTRFGTDSESTLDYALIKNLNWPSNVDSLPELSSDYNLIRLHFPKTTKFEIPPPQLNTTWSIFTDRLAQPDNLNLHTARTYQEFDS